MHVNDDEINEDLTVNDDSLQIIDKNTFDKAQNEMEKISNRYSKEPEAKDVDTLIDQFGLFVVMDCSPIVEFCCPKCNSRMRSNGTRDLTGDIVTYNLECVDCGNQRRYPYRTEYEKMKKKAGD